MTNISVILVVLFINSCITVSLPSTFPKCNRNQANFNDCLTNAVKESLHQLRKPHPEVSLPSFNPLRLSEISIAAGTSAVHFRQNFKNIKGQKLTEFSSLNASMDFDKHVLELEVDYPEVMFSFDYDINGNILVMPIRGKGPATVIIKNCLLKITFNLQESNNHYKILNTRMLFDRIEDFHINFENLFNGDKALGANINNVINQNWKDIFNDIKGGYEEAGAKTIQRILENFLTKVSVKELFGEV